jgi:hypothetical protein
MTSILPPVTVPMQTSCGAYLKPCVIIFLGAEWVKNCCLYDLSQFSHFKCRAFDV